MASNSAPDSGVASIGARGADCPPYSEKIVKNQEKEGKNKEKERKNWEKMRKRGKWEEKDKIGKVLLLYPS